MADLIDRQMTIDALCKSECGWNNAECRHKDDTDFCVTCDNVKIIKSLPSIQSERKVGKWIRGKSWSEGAGMGESYGHYWKCNQCNNIVKGDWSQCGDNFCSNCGADMRGDKYETN